MRWYLRPKNLKTAWTEGRRIRAGGGPKSVTLSRVTEPQGVFLPSASVKIDVQAKDGTKASFEPEFLVPWPLAYGYRAARALNAPVVRDLDPDAVNLTLKRPGG